MLRKGAFKMNLTTEKTNEAPKYVFRGEIYMVDFSDGEGRSVHQGSRPAVIISNDVANRYSAIVNCCLLTSKTMKKDYPTHLKLTPNAMNKLRMDSVIMAEQVRTIGRETLKFKIGKLTDEEIQALDDVIRVALGL